MTISVDDKWRFYRSDRNRTDAMRNWHFNSSVFERISEEILRFALFLYIKVSEFFQADFVGFSQT